MKGLIFLLLISPNLFSQNPVKSGSDKSVYETNYPKTSMYYLGFRFESIMYSKFQTGESILPFPSSLYFTSLIKVNEYFNPEIRMGVDLLPGNRNSLFGTELGIYNKVLLFEFWNYIIVGYNFHFHGSDGGSTGHSDYPKTFRMLSVGTGFKLSRIFTMELIYNYVLNPEWGFNNDINWPPSSSVLDKYYSSVKLGFAFAWGL